MDQQIIATNITLIAVALLATSLIVIVPTWKRFNTHRVHTPAEAWNKALKIIGMMLLLPIMLIASAMLSQWISLETWYYEWPDFIVLMMIVLTLPVFFYATGRWIWRRFRGIKKDKGKIEPEIPMVVGNLSALWCFVISIILIFFTFMATIPISVDIKVGGHPQQDDFEFGRAMILIIPTVLGRGLMWLAFSFVVESRSVHRNGFQGSQDTHQIPQAN